MVTQTLLQGVMNTFVVFFSRIIGWVVDRQISATKTMLRVSATT